MAIDRVYFVGAGLSAPFGYPLGATLPLEIVRHLRSDYRRSRHEAEARAVLSALTTMLQHYLGLDIDLERADKHSIDAAMRTIDLAQFYSVAQTLSEGAVFIAQRSRRSSAPHAEPENGPVGAASPLELLYGRLAAATRSLFVKLSKPQGHTVPDFRALTADIVKNRKRHAVVCFNWDEELDLQLGQERQSVDVAYTLGEWREEPSRVLLLKPHGSIGWYDVAHGIGNSYSYFVAEHDKRLVPSSLRVVSYYELGRPKRLGLNVRKDFSPLECPPVITPPTFVKRFDYVEQRLVWRDVIEVCSNAKEFVFLGYSLPSDDFLTRAALSSAIASGRRARRSAIKCLFVGLYDGRPEAAVVKNFTRCFEGFRPELHILPWLFAKGPLDARGKPIQRERRELVSRIEAKLRHAAVAGA